MTKEQRKAYYRKWCKDNAEYVLKYKRKWAKHHAKQILEQIYKWRKDNAKYFLEYQREYRRKNRKRILKYVEEYRKKNKDKIFEYHRKSREKNRARDGNLQRIWKINKYNTSPGFALSRRISAGIRNSLRRRKKYKSGFHWETLVGYTAEELKRHLESLFLEGMTWTNREKWQIDHIVPESFFIFDKPTDQEFLYCWSLDNLQPLWSRDNIIKSDKTCFDKRNEPEGGQAI